MLQHWAPPALQWRGQTGTPHVAVTPHCHLEGKFCAEVGLATPTQPFILLAKYYWKGTAVSINKIQEMWSRPGEFVPLMEQEWLSKWHKWQAGLSQQLVLGGSSEDSSQNYSVTPQLYSSVLNRSSVPGKNILTDDSINQPSSGLFELTWLLKIFTSELLSDMTAESGIYYK